jgi:opacity protein-like surface antigen
MALEGVTSGTAGIGRRELDADGALVTPGFERSSTLATSINAGIEFKPTSNLTLSLSGSFVQSSPSLDTDMHSQSPFVQNPGIFGRR